MVTKKPAGKTSATGKPSAASASSGKSTSKKAVPAAKSESAKPAGRAGAAAKPPAGAGKVDAKAARAAATAAKAAAKPPAKLKSPYNKKELVPLHAQLLALRARLMGDMDALGGEALRANEPEVDADDVADLGTDAFERQMNLGLMETEAKTLRRIDTALRLMDGGVYGLCQGCSQAIPLARLQALPFATNCVPCQEAEERWL